MCRSTYKSKYWNISFSWRAYIIWADSVYINLPAQWCRGILSLVWLSEVVHTNKQAHFLTLANRWCVFLLPVCRPPLHWAAPVASEPNCTFVTNWHLATVAPPQHLSWRSPSPGSPPCHFKNSAHSRSFYRTAGLLLLFLRRPPVIEIWVLEWAEFPWHHKQTVWENKWT